MQATVSMAIMNMASLISTTTKEFRENTGNIMTASTHNHYINKRQLQAAQEWLGTNDIL
jgi:hypothetical protein